MAIERRLTEIAGRVGGKIHTGRSRNDQVATDLAMFVADRARVAARAARRPAAARSAALAAEHRDCRLPGYTHLQRAQPVSLGHHLLAWFWMLRRDVDRFAAAAAPAGAMPLGSGALAGLNWELDREAVAAELGFDRRRRELDRRRLQPRFRARLPRRRPRSARPTSRGSAPRSCSGRPASSASAGRPRSSRSGSSIMPQKMNPDAAELLRAKAPRVVAALTTLLGVHARPAARLQQGPAGGQGAALRRRRHDRALPRGARRDAAAGSSFDRERMAAAAADEMAAATDVADLLVRRGLPFREAHGVVGGLVRHALEAGIAALGDPPGGARRLLRAARRRVLRGARRGISWLDSKLSRGGTSATAVADAARAGRGEPRRRSADGRGRGRASIALLRPRRRGTSPPI